MVEMNIKKGGRERKGEGKRQGKEEKRKGRGLGGEMERDYEDHRTPMTVVCFVLEYRGASQQLQLSTPDH